MKTLLNTARQNNKGFGAIEALLILVVFVALASAGWYVWRTQHKNISSNTQNNQTTTKPDPYTGWKTYTDSQHHYSFKYPASGWTIDTASTEQITLLNADKSAEVDYLYVNPHSNGVVSFTPFSIDDLNDTTQGLKIVGGLYDGAPLQYNLVDASLLKTYPLTIGQPSQFLAYPHFTDTHVAGGTTTGTFRAESAASVAQASTWSSSIDGKTSLLILRSFMYQR